MKKKEIAQCKFSKEKKGGKKGLKKNTEKSTKDWRQLPVDKTNKYLGSRHCVVYTSCKPHKDGPKHEIKRENKIKTIPEYSNPLIVDTSTSKIFKKGIRSDESVSPFPP